MLAAPAASKGIRVGAAPSFFGKLSVEATFTPTCANAKICGADKAGGCKCSREAYKVGEAVQYKRRGEWSDGQITKTVTQDNTKKFLVETEQGKIVRKAVEKIRKAGLVTKLSG